MSWLAPALQAFFTDRLAQQRQASPKLKRIVYLIKEDRVFAGGVQS